MLCTCYAHAMHMHMHMLPAPPRARAHAMHMLRACACTCSCACTCACGAGARLLQYQLERPGPRGGPFDWHHAADADHILHALTRLFYACARAEAVPRAALDLLSHLVSPELSGAAAGERSLTGRRRACLNALLFACGAAAMPAAAAAVHRQTLEAGVAPDLTAINAVVSAFGRAGKLDEAFEVFEEARRQPETIGVASDSYVITSLISACAVRRDAARAEQLYEAALLANVVPTRALLNALCSAHATAGNVEAATRSFEDMRQLGLALAKGGQQQPEGRPQDKWQQEGTHHKEPRHSASEEDTALATVLNACNMANQPQRALELAERLFRDGFRPTSAAPYVQLLRACAGRPSRASVVWEAALASGIRPSSAMLNALVRACAHSGDMQAAFRAARRGQTHGLPPDVGTVNALLHGCMVSREVPNAWRCMRLADELGVEPNTKTHNLLLAAHLAALQRAPRRLGPRDEELLRQAQQLYERGVDLGWEWQQSTKRWLLRICAVRDQMPYALRMVAEMEARGDELFAPLNDLVHACHRVNQIDDEALRLWEEGGRLEGGRLEGGRLESWKGDVAPGTLVSPGLLFKPDR